MIIKLICPHNHMTDNVSQGDESSKKTITISKSFLWMTVAVILAIALVGTLFFTGVFSGITGFGPATIDNGNAPSVIKYTIPEGAHMIGNADAPITIVEFSDFECPFCSRFYKETLPSIEKEWIDTGKVKLYYLQYPLSFHPQAMPAAKATECAAEQSKFWEYHNIIFENQAKLATEGIFSTWAAEIGLDVEKFNTCFESTKYDGKINKDMADGNTVGVSGTPSFLIGNEKDGYQLVVGAQPYTVFKQVLSSQ